MKGGSARIGNAQAKFPLFCPRLGLFVLANFYQNLIGALVEFPVYYELIDACPAPVVFVAGERSLPFTQSSGVFGTDPELLGGRNRNRRLCGRKPTS